MWRLVRPCAFSSICARTGSGRRRAHFPGAYRKKSCSPAGLQPTMRRGPSGDVIHVISSCAPWQLTSACRAGLTYTKTVSHKIGVRSGKATSMNFPFKILSVRRHSLRESCTANAWLGRALKNEKVQRCPLAGPDTDVLPELTCTKTVSHKIGVRSGKATSMNFPFKILSVRRHSFRESCTANGWLGRALKNEKVQRCPLAGPDTDVLPFC